MVVSKQLSKQIFIEILALLFLIGVIIYAVFAIDKSNQNNISSQDGFVIVLDDEKNGELVVSSDGEGLETEGVTYTITNNNSDKRTYKVVIIPSVLDEEVLKQVRVSINDLYVENLTELERYNGGYVLTTNSLGAGYTKIHLFKYWYKLDTSKDIADTKIDFEYKLVIE